LVSIDTNAIRGRCYRLPMQAELLRRAPLFAAMPDRVVVELAARATRRRLKKGQRAMGRGGEGSEGGRGGGAVVLVLVTGRLEVIGETEVNLAGREVAGGVVRSLVPPAVVGLSIAAGAVPTAELRAAEDSEIVSLPAEAVRAAMRRYPEAALAAIAHLGGVIGELSTEVAALRVHGLVERVRHRLRRLAAGRREVVITHALLAEEVGGTRANVSRALARLESEGEITRKRGRIQLR
jgi:CRP-like cAMP-binding protein